MILKHFFVKKVYMILGNRKKKGNRDYITISAFYVYIVLIFVLQYCHKTSLTNTRILHETCFKRTTGCSDCKLK